MSRLLIQPGDREEEDKDQGRDYDPPKGYERVTGEEHQHLVVEHKEPLGPGHVGIGAEVHRLGEGRGYQVGQGNDDRQEDSRSGEVRYDLSGEEPHGLVRPVVDVLVGYYLSRFYRLYRAFSYFHLPLPNLSSSRELPVLAHQVQVYTDKGSQKRRQEPHVDDKHATERRRAGRVPPEEKGGHVLAYKGRVG